MPKVEATDSSLLAAEQAGESRVAARFGLGGRALRRRARFYAGLAILCIFYTAAIFAELLAPYDYRAQSRGEPFAPPSAIRFRDAQGDWHVRPFIYTRRLVDPLERRYAEQTERAFPLELFARGYQYRLLG
ncbi:MAG: hypothetical protein H0X14_07745, partial [Acidobacteria bacterium]|nr:hypothetical protein [Acidobacteriota bacterium]